MNHRIYVWSHNEWVELENIFYITTLNQLRIILTILYPILRGPYCFAIVYEPILWGV